MESENLKSLAGIYGSNLPGLTKENTTNNQYLHLIKHSTLTPSQKKLAVGALNEFLRKIGPTTVYNVGDLIKKEHYGIVNNKVFCKCDMCGITIHHIDDRVRHHMMNNERYAGGTVILNEDYGHTSKIECNNATFRIVKQEIQKPDMDLKSYY